MTERDAGHLAPGQVESRVLWALIRETAELRPAKVRDSSECRGGREEGAGVSLACWLLLSRALPIPSDEVRALPTGPAFGSPHVRWLGAWGRMLGSMSTRKLYFDENM
jgi:hypothetical protein